MKHYHPHSHLQPSQPRDAEDIARHDMELVCQNKSANYVGQFRQNFGQYSLKEYDTDLHQSFILSAESNKQ